MVNAVTDIQEDTLVEVVISSQQLGEEDIEIRPHSLSVHSYKTPTFCHFCGELLMGLFKQVSEIYGLNSTLAISVHCTVAAEDRETLEFNIAQNLIC